MKSKTYIIAWDGAIDNCLDISRQLNNSDVNHVFYNVSSIEDQNSNWVRRPDIRYNRHFFSAMQDFIENGYDVFIFNTGDIAYPDYIGYTKYIETIFSENPKLGAFAPNNTNDVFSGDKSMLRHSNKYDNLYLSTNTNGSYLALNKDIVKHMFKFYEWCSETETLDFSTTKTGWGLDMSYCALVIYLNRVIYRDSGVEMFHPKDQSYNNSDGSIEYKQVIDAFKSFCAYVGFNEDRVINIIELTVKKVRDQLVEVNIKDVYANPEKVADA